MQEPASSSALACAVDKSTSDEHQPQTSSEVSAHPTSSVALAATEPRPADSGPRNESGDENSRTTEIPAPAEDRKTEDRKKLHTKLDADISGSESSPATRLVSDTEDERQDVDDPALQQQRRTELSAELLQMVSAGRLDDESADPYISKTRMRACAACRRAKTACDEQRPCPRCVRLAIECCAADVKPKKTACVNCHKAKTACDGIVPCRRCTRLGIMCTLPETKKPSRGKRSRHKAGTSDDVDELNAPLDSMEERVLGLLSTSEATAALALDVAGTQAADNVEILPSDTGSAKSRKVEVEHSLFDTLSAAGDKMMSEGDEGRLRPAKAENLMEVC